MYCFESHKSGALFANLCLLMCSSGCDTSNVYPTIALILMIGYPLSHMTIASANSGILYCFASLNAVVV